MKKKDKIDKGRYIKADLYARKNLMNGKYKAAQLDDLESKNFSNIKDSDIFFLESLQMKANLADKIIAEAELQGKDINSLNVMKELGQEIKAAGQPIHMSESLMTTILVSLQIIAYYGIAVGIWSLVFKKSFLIFGLFGAGIGLLLSLFIVAPVIIVKRTRERIRDIVSGVGLSIGNFGIIIGIVGLIAWIIRLIFFV